MLRQLTSIMRRQWSFLKAMFHSVCAINVLSRNTGAEVKEAKWLGDRSAGEPLVI